MKKSKSSENLAMSTLQDPRWDAVVARDSGAEGKFFYSVRTTGVYCRPSCASRRPRPENVRFHDTSQEAEAAGFRPCKRCAPTGASLDQKYTARVREACRIIESSETPPPLAALARRVNVSAYHFHRVFKRLTGLTPHAYAAAHRTRRVRAELEGGGTVTAAILDAGFNSNGRFYERSNEVLGMTPTRFRSGGKNIVIRFAVGECSLGSIMVASTARGVCAISLGDDPDALVRELQDRFAKAELVGGDKSFEEMVARVVGFVEAPGVGWDLPLDVRGTAFQQRVWQALRRIPAGQTTSYSDIAKRIGSPRAVRAVAQACAANAIAVAIPCHRVIKTDGGISGYRWGVERKSALLQRERLGRGRMRSLQRSA